MVEYGILCKAASRPTSVDLSDEDAVAEPFARAAGGAIEQIGHALNKPPSISGPVEVISHQFVQVASVMLLTVLFKYSVN